jgi:DNA-binding SARP family transcriptional activator
VDDLKRVADLQQAVSLYSDDYLSSVYSDWAVDMRRLLQGRYFDALRYLVDALMRMRQFDRALDHCRHGLRFDYYREDLHRCLIQCLAEIGRRTEALAHFEALSQRLRHDLQVQPELETLELARRLRIR